MPKIVSRLHEKDGPTAFDCLLITTARGGRTASVRRTTPMAAAIVQSAFTPVVQH
jgi:hypothetical protein